MYGIFAMIPRRFNTYGYIDWSVTTTLKRYRDKKEKHQAQSISWAVPFAPFEIIDSTHTVGTFCWFALPVLKRRPH